MTDHVHQNAEEAAVEAALDPRAVNEAAASAAPAAAEETVQELKDQLAAAKQNAEDSHDRYLRTRAEMENYKKRIERTYADLAKTSKKDLLRKLLGVQDNLERALQYQTTSDAAGEGLIEGVRLTQYQLEQLLAQEGVQPIEANGKAFDPHLEEAIQSVDDPNVPDQTVVQVVRSGYTYQDEVLRPAQVIVSVHGSGD